jgi:digeranylgeranylglycerophospholipid reductase
MEGNKMTRNYDVIVVGAGPGGLMAAKTASENGLKVALLERKTNIPDIKRACSARFVSLTSYYLGERPTLNARDGYLSFPVNGFSIKYSGPFKNYYAWQTYSPGGVCVELGDYEENSRKGDEGRIDAVFDKRALLESLLTEVKEKSVEIFPNTNVIGVEKTKEGVKVTANGKTFMGTFVIAADGKTSRITKGLGFNKERVYCQDSVSYGFDMSGLELPRPHAFINIFIGGKPPWWCFILPKAVKEDMHFVFISSLHPGGDFVRAFEYLTKESKFSAWFKNAKRERVYCSAGNIFSPVEEPFRDNVLLVGDACFSWEAECTGAIMQGWKAANAITVAIMDNKLDKEGVSSYLQWWKESYLDRFDYREFLRFSATPNILTEQDIDYIFTLIKEKVLPCSLFDIYNPEGLYEASANSSIIQKERPEIIPKLKKLATAPLEELLLENAKAGFPNL